MDLQHYHLESGIRIEDPYSQQDLSELVRFEAERTSVRLLNFYHVQGERVFCHICAGKRHWRGFTGEVSSGEKILFGSTCAKEYFGEEIATKAFSELRRRIRRENAKFAILTFKGSIEPLEMWLKSYGDLVDKTQDIWDDLFFYYGDPAKEITENLQKNSGRLVETADILVGHSDGKAVYETKYKILVSFSGHDSIPYLTRLKQRISQLRHFCMSVKNVKLTENFQLFENIDRYFKESLRAAGEIDAALTFTYEFLHPEKLPILSDWLEKNRALRVSNAQLTKRDFAKIVRKQAGFAYPKIDQKLFDAVSSCVLPVTDIISKSQVIQSG